ncbi:MAG: hypothetical protein QM715_01260 [Nibricoccus sp.]
MKIQFEDGPEALEWLRLNGHEAALASNRFPSTSEAAAFVEHLYAIGAKRVFVPQDAIIADEEEVVELGGPYSDSLVIELSDAGVSEELAAIYREEATLEGYDLSKEPLPIIEGRFLYLWWD